MRGAVVSSYVMSGGGFRPADMTAATSPILSDMRRGRWRR